MSRRQLLLLGGGILLAVSVLPGTGGSQDQHGSTAKATLSSEPVFKASFRDLKWKVQPLRQWQGKYLVLYFWATWCKPCRHEVPELITLYKGFGARNAVVVGIAVDNADKVAAFAKQYGINYPLLVGGDEAMELSKKMGNHIGGLPYTIVIDPRGRVLQTLLGETKEGTLTSILSPLLG